MFVGLSTSIVSASNLAKCVSLNNYKCMTQHTLLNLHSNKQSEELHYYPFAIILIIYLIEYVFQT